MNSYYHHHEIKLTSLIQLHNLRLAYLRLREPYKEICCISLCVGVTSYQSKLSYNYRYTQLNSGH